MPDLLHRILTASPGVQQLQNPPPQQDRKQEIIAYLNFLRDRLIEGNGLPGGELQAEPARQQDAPLQQQEEPS